jgi:hypothetical protein
LVIIALVDKDISLSSNIIERLIAIQTKYVIIYIIYLRVFVNFSLSIKINLLFNYSIYFWGKYFGKVKNGQKKCPKIEKGKTMLPKCVS